MINLKQKIFCVSMQRSGTTSVGVFFKKNGFKVADYHISKNNLWTQNWYKGDYEAVFKSKAFRRHVVFEDDPWWCPDFYKVLFHRFPKSRFILMFRDSNDWFKSMVNHSDGKTLGNTKIHAKIYNREIEYLDYIKENKINDSIQTVDNLLNLSNFKQHYINIYENHNRTVVNFFKNNAPERLFISRLEDSDKWEKLGAFFKIKLPPNFDVHENKSQK